jgi:hypothetical protein
MLAAAMVAAQILARPVGRPRSTIPSRLKSLLDFAGIDDFALLNLPVYGKEKGPR